MAMTIYKELFYWIAKILGMVEIELKEWQLIKLI